MQCHFNSFEKEMEICYHKYYIEKKMVIRREQYFTFQSREKERLSVCVCVRERERERENKPGIPQSEWSASEFERTVPKRQVRKSFLSFPHSIQKSGVNYAFCVYNVLQQKVHVAYWKAYR